MVDRCLERMPLVIFVNFYSCIACCLPISSQDFSLAYCASDIEIFFLLMCLDIYDNELWNCNSPPFKVYSLVTAPLWTLILQAEDCPFLRCGLPCFRYRKSYLPTYGPSVAPCIRPCSNPELSELLLFDPFAVRGLVRPRCSTFLQELRTKVLNCRSESGIITPDP